jgi:hypothetical protein
VLLWCRPQDKEMISSLLDMKAGLDVVLVEAFARNESFANALKEAFEQFINQRQNKCGACRASLCWERNPVLCCAVVRNSTPCCSAHHGDRPARGLITGIRIRLPNRAQMSYPCWAMGRTESHWFQGCLLQNLPMHSGCCLVPFGMSSLCLSACLPAFLHACMFTHGMVLCPCWHVLILHCVPLTTLLVACSGLPLLCFVLQSSASCCSLIRGSGMR